MSFSNISDDDAAALRELFRRVLYGVHTSMPGVITAVGTYKGVRVVSVQPVIQQLDTLDDERTFKAIDPIPNVVVITPHAEDLGLSMTIPLRVGNEGMIHFAERGLDNWLEKGGVQPPTEPVQPRSHDLSDAVFVPGITSVVNPITDWSDDAIEVRNKDATVALSVSVDTVAMRSGAELISMPGDGNIYITGNIIHTGSTAQTGNVLLTGSLAATVTLAAITVTATSALLVDGVEIGGHSHGPGSFEVEVDSNAIPVTGTSDPI